MDWFAPIDIYCERTAVGFWNEPLNAISNLAFILAALWGFYALYKRNIWAPPLVLVTVLAFLIGIGSFLFHTFANGWSEQADVIPIWTFVAVYILISIHYFGNVNFGRIGLGLAILIALGFIAYWIMGGGVTSDTAAPVAVAKPDPLNGSGQYAPAVIAFIVIGILSYVRKVDVRHWIGAAGVTFFFSLVARTIDQAVCPVLPIGTHFIWHTLNGLMIGLLLQAIIRHVSAKRARTA
ncbi:ceramidase domain-containing protein [Rhizobium sp. L1K21]|uniref:ceramidase domain-containing protein n=1 Tax=Rhizobium sp. L1K21 TaxID=2954933 RepID=UPI002092D4CF|nr:ceramidase domain-containing protein [Rhizobium sp. L1K21]MCO6185846.1 ceramidase [Rhizobium sp. L1K21]